MNIYFKNQKGDGLIEKGAILTVGAANRRSILTGDNEKELTCIGIYESEEKASEVLDVIIERVVSPTKKEIEKGIIYIELN